MSGEFRSGGRERRVGKKGQREGVYEKTVHKERGGTVGKRETIEREGGWRENAEGRMV